MRIKKWFLFLLCTVTSIAYAQNSQSPSLDIADPSPSLYVQEWIKGNPVQQMEKGQIYVIEFWATWCRPCIGAMPHLSALASTYKDKVTIIGVSVQEQESTSVKQIREFVGDMGDRMNYHVAIDDENRMVDEWLRAFDEKKNGIPRTFVVNTEGRVAWIGHPKDLDTVLRKMLDNNWDIDQAAETRHEERRLDSLRSEVSSFLTDTKYNPDTQRRERVYATPESMLAAIEKIVRDEPKLKNTTTIASHTFGSLLRIDQKKAYDYGKSVLISAEKDRRYLAIIDVIKYYPEELNLLPEIYSLGAEAYQELINLVPYPEVVDMANSYSKMAKWYWLANDKPKAIASQQKAVESLKSEKDFSASDLMEYESQLQQYKGEETVK